MQLQLCTRCGKEEYIPPCQFVKFDEHPHYLDKACWESLGIFLKKHRALPSDKHGSLQDICGLCQTSGSIPAHQSIKLGTDSKVIYLGGNCCWKPFQLWYHAIRSHPENKTY